MKDSKINALRWMSRLIISLQSKNLFFQKNEILLEIKKFLTKKDIKDYFFQYFKFKLKKLNILRVKKNSKKKKVYLRLL